MEFFILSSAHLIALHQLKSATQKCIRSNRKVILCISIYILPIQEINRSNLKSIRCKFLNENCIDGKCSAKTKFLNIREDLSFTSKVLLVVFGIGLIVVAMLFALVGLMSSERLESIISKGTWHVSLKFSGTLCLL